MPAQRHHTLSYHRVMRRLAVLALLAACGGGDDGTTTPPTPGWMSTQSDDVLLSALTIPGTHESAANYEPLAGTAKAQTMTLAEQLAAGVRYFDIRCHDLDDSFLIYHGPVSEQQTFQQVLDTFDAFLDANPTETTIMSIKEEDAAEGPTQSFEATFDGYVAAEPDRWILGDTVPALGDVRGKIVLLRRFDAVTMPLGLDASAWADNTTFTLTTDATLRIEDQYNVTSTDTKWTEITELLGEAQIPDPGTLYLTYTSGYTTHDGLPNIEGVSNVVNPMLDTYFADPTHLNGHLGVLAMDQVTEPRIKTLAAFNLPSQ
jgi:1-phosphatidylinositol phosphodiesterase